MKWLSAIMLILFAHYYVTAQNKQPFKVRATQPIPNIKIKSPLFNRAELAEKIKRSNLFNIKLRPAENDFNNRLNDSLFVIKRINSNTAPIFISSHASSSKKIMSSSKNKKSFETTVAAKQFLLKISSLLGWKNTQPPFRIRNTTTDALGKTHIKLDQIQDGYKVYGVQVAIHLNEIGEGNIFSGNYADATKTFKKNMAITKNTALKTVIKDIETQSTIIQFSNETANLINYHEPVIDTVYYPSKITNEYLLAYKITIRANYIDHYEYLLDAVTGKIIKRINKACTLYGPASTNAVDLNGQAVPVNSYSTNGKYYLWDVTKPMFRNTTNGVIRTWDGLGTNENNLSYSEITSADNTWLDQRAVSAHFNAGKVYDYFYNAHSRNSIDNNGKNLISFINIKDVDNTELDNAYYSYPFMLYGNGKKHFKPLAGSLDVAAHEITHAVTDFSAQLVYEFQSGALSESFSDIFGAMVDSSNWLIGEQIVKPAYFPSGALRSLADPHNGGGNNWQPKHMNEYVFLSQDQDNGGVHANSGITNHAFYLLANAIGRKNAAKIFYRALTTYLTSYAQFIDLRLAAVQSVEDLFDSTQKINIINQVKLAFDQVGIVDVVTEYVESYIPINPGTEALIFNGLSSNWGIYSNDLNNNNTKVIAQKANTKPTLTDDGQWMFFVGSDYRIYAANPGLNFTQTVTNVQTDPIWHSVAISKDGKRLAATTLSADTSIYVFDLSKTPNTYKKFIVHNPTNAHGVSATFPLYADIMEWDYNGEYLYYDALNTTGSFDFWDISKIKVWDNQLSTFTSAPAVSKLVQLNVNSGENTGNPSLTKNSPYTIAFDYFKAYSGEYFIFGYDMLHNQLDTIIRNNTVGFPSYNKYDTKLAYQTDMTGYEDYAVNTVNLNADKISAASVGLKAIQNAKWPIYFANGVRAFYTPPTPLITASGSIEFCDGDSVILQSSAAFGNKWYINGVLSNSDTGTYLIVKTAGNYALKTVINGISSFFSDTIHVLVNNTPPKPVSLYTDTIQYCLNETAAVLNITPLIGCQILWYDTVSLGGIGASSAILPRTDSAGVFNYYVSQINSKGCESKRTSITVQVSTFPKKPIVHNDTICIGNTATLWVDSTSGITYKWYDAISGGALLHTGGKFDTTLLTLDTIKIFVSSARNGCENNSRSLVMSIVNSIPNPPIVHGDTVCKGVASMMWVDSSQGFIYKWYNQLNNGELLYTGSKIDTLLLNTDSFKVFVSANQSGCESSRTMGKAFVNPIPNSPLIHADTVCKGSTTNIWIDSLIGTTYKWHASNGNVSLLHEGNHLVTILPTLDTLFLSISAVKKGCESSSTIKKIFVNAIPVAPIVQTDTIKYCRLTDAISLNATPTMPNSLHWYDTLSVGGSSTTKATIPRTDRIGIFNYYVSQVTRSGCESNRSVIVIEIKDQLPQPQLLNGDTIQYCLNAAPRPLSLSVVNNNNNTLFWYDTIGIKSKALTELVLPDVSKSGITNYYVSQINERYCESDRKQITVKVNPKPAPPLVQLFNFCADEQTHVLTINPIQNQVSIWFGTDTLTNTTSPNPPEVLANKPGVFNYYVRQYNLLTGCMSNTSAVNVNIWAIPEMPFIKQDAAGKLVSSIPIGNKWYTDSMILSDTGAVIKPTKSGYYTVRASANGCNSVMSKKYYYQLEQLNDLAPNEYFNLFPNPFNTSFKINFSFYQSEKINVSIYELGSGKLLAQQLNITTGSTILFNPLMEGIYIIKVTTSNNQRTIVRKIIKRNK